MRMHMRMSEETALTLIHDISNAVPGETVVYHTGQLLFDRTGDRNLSMVANHVLNLAVHGQGLLTQRIVGHFYIGDKEYSDFEYRYTAAKHPHKIVAKNYQDTPEVVEKQGAAAHARLPREKVVSL